MPWLVLRVEVEPAAADALSDALLEQGAQSVSIDDIDAPRTSVSALFPEHADPRSALARCGAAAPANVLVERLEDGDWVRHSQAQFAPVRIGRLWIGPRWCEPPADASALVRIDPGLAFGTGSHATTRLVLGWLETVMRGGERVLDYGCGSGILAIAAAKLGAGAVDAVDSDPQAVEVTRENAQANGVALGALAPQALEPGRYDLVVANILAQPLIALAPVLAAHAAGGGQIALAGVLDTQVDAVVQAYAGDFDMALGASEHPWVLLRGVRR